MLAVQGKGRQAMKPVSFTVFGSAEPKGSARAFVRGGRAIVTSDNPSLSKWEAVVRNEAQRIAELAGHRLFQAAVTISVVFHMPRPKSVNPRVRPFPQVKPDLSKLVRGLEDPLTGILFTDDAQVIGIGALKLYTDGPAKAVVTVRQIITPEDLAAFTNQPCEVVHVV
jgi:Holliday junction resolvase RusA-like endonuclease